MRPRALAWMLLCGYALFGPSAGAQTVHSVDFPSITCISKEKSNDSCSAIQVKGKLYQPVTPSTVLVVISHGSQGVDPRHQAYATALNSAGFAALVVDHWAPRGVGNISSDYQRNWEKGATSFNAAFDVLQGMRVLGPRMGFTRFGLIGESQGGNAALWADKRWFLSEYKRVFGYDAQLPNVIVALYPGCFERSFADSYLPTPFLIVTGSSDNNTPATLCQRYVEWMNSRGGRATFLALPNQHHDFDAPYSARKTSAQNPSRCASYLDRTTRTWDETGEVFPLTRDGNAAFWKKCYGASANATMIGGHSGNSKTGFNEWLGFFRANLPQ